MFFNRYSRIQEKGTLPPKYRQHKLTGKYTGCWECHIQLD